LQKRQILVTAALPYANGDIHLGHLVEHFQVDFWSRFQRMRGHECTFVCADDTHGTPIMVNAQKQGITPEELIARCKERHLADFAAFQIGFDHYGSTNSETNHKYVNLIYEAMTPHLSHRSIEQLYCPKDQMFLPDRFVKGICPKCQSVDQYGDACEVCGTTYEPTDLKNPACSLCGTSPTLQASEHVFFRLNDFRDFLQGWVQEHTQAEVKNKLQEWLGGELRDWDISRDKPYFGFPIPGKKDKYFYVWVDAPIGYISATDEWCAMQKPPRDPKSYWQDSEKAEVYHFIGKDIVYFHTLFWPAMLSAARFRTPTKVFVHGFLTVDGVKMSKSKGTFIKAETFRKYIDPMYLRYYLACKMGSGVDDLDLSLDDFVSRVNSELLEKKLDGKLGQITDNGLVKTFQNQEKLISELYENREFNRVMLELRDLADAANRYVDDNQPWKSIQSEPEKTRGTITTALNLFRLMAIYLKPILPSYVDKVATLFGEAPYNWNSLHAVVQGTALKPYEHLASRIEGKDVQKIVEASKEGTPEKTDTAGSTEATATAAVATTGATITIDDFQKIKLKVGKILTAEAIPEASKLLKLTIDLGEANPRTIMAGIKSAYNGDALVGKHVVVVANLAPRKMRFGVSEGMVLATGDGEGIMVLTPDASGGKAPKPGADVS
jgi:methionyl-tRNA synthetase